jgi:oligopeptide/dipeptide ABC transporter ATP-binding protein
MRTPVAEKVLSVADLHVSLSPRRGLGAEIVRGVSFSLTRGETVAVIGESGCGKTTLALAIGGLLPRGLEATRGGVDFEGTPLVGADERVLCAIRGRRLGMVFQDAIGTLNPLRTVGSILTEAARRARRSKAVARTRARECLAMVGLPAGVAEMYPHELSGGMRQRAAIAIAIVNEPALLIADEPTTALDATVQAQVLDVLDGLRLEMAMLVITHDIAVAAELADRIMVMYAGAVLETGPTQELFQRPKHPYTAGLLRARPTLRGPRGVPLEVIRGVPPPLGSEMPAGCVFANRCDRARDQCQVEPPLSRFEDRDVACWYPIEERLATG